MPFELTAALVVALIVAVWRLAHRRPRFASGPLPNVGDAPPSAEPITQPRLNDNGLATYSLDLSATGDRREPDRWP